MSSFWGGEGWRSSWDQLNVSFCCFKLGNGQERKAEMYEKVRSVKLALLHNSPTQQSKADRLSAILASLPSWMSKWRSATRTLSTMTITCKLKAKPGGGDADF